MRISWGAWLLATCFLGCGPDYSNHEYSSAAAGRSSTQRNPRGSGGRSGIGGTGSGDSLAPVVTITSPKAARDPDVDPVVTEDEVEETCTVAASTASGAKDVDTSTVKLALLDASGKVLQEVPGVRTENAGEYSAKFVLADVPSGPLSFACSAADSGGRSSTARVDTFIDHGPEITVDSPLADSARSPESAVKFQFSVAPVALTTGDDGAPLKDVTLQINGVDMDLSKAEDSTKKGSYSLEVDFNDTTVFKPRPTGHVPVVITATNARKPDGVVSKLTYQFTLDATGPDIVITSPIAQSVLGGQITLEFKVTDPEPSSGVDKDTVVVKIGDTEKHRYSTNDGLWTERDGTYTFTFNSRIIPVTTVLLNVNVLASDLAGNASIGAGTQYHLDNLPPVADLDPANIRELRTVDANDVCSDPFDPVGSQAANDLGVVPDVLTLRAVLFDKTNGADGLKVRFPARIDDDTVQLFAQADTSKPLLVDTDGDKVCDELDPDLRQTLPFQPLVPIVPGGEPPSSGLAGIQGVCGPAETVEPPPPFLCSGSSDMRRVIQDTYIDSTVVPVVYGIGAHAECLSSQWQLPPLLKQNGWVCLAVRATDRAHNVGISRPIRVCLNSKAYPAPACATSSTVPPTCTDGCSPPPRFAPPYITRF